MKVMISCGEPSGDLYAGALAAEIRQIDPSARVFGLGGRHLEEAGADLIADYHGLTVTGLVEVLKILPRSLSTYRRLVKAARDRRPDVFVAVDFPDFNFRLARAVRRLGIPVVYYVGPQLWAWRPRRLQTMKRIVDRVLVIFPFEESIYAKAGVPVQFVGHPLIDLARARAPRDVFLPGIGLATDRPTVAILPGSRPNEVSGILPVLSRAMTLIADRVPGVQFVVARAPGLDDRLFAGLDASTPRPVVVEARTDDVLAASDIVITASGTATVQAGIHGRPMIVVYRLAPLTYRLGKPFVRIDTYAMVNLVAGRRIVPELIQDAFTPEAVASEATALLTDRSRAEAMQASIAEVCARLGSSGASRRAAESVLAVGREGRRESPSTVSREARAER